jgi:HTH-type transcriptional regulator/antitoxin HipB
MRQLISSPKQVGEIVRGRRKAHGVSQKALSEKLGITQGRLSMLESAPGSMTLERLLLLGKLLGFEVVLQDRSERTGPKAEW